MFKFKSAYAVSHKDETFRYVAVGVRPRVDFRGVEFLVPGSVPRNFEGKVLSDDNDTIIMDVKEGEKRILVKFEYLTKERFAGMVEHITGGKAVNAQLETTRDIQEFYVHNFLPKFWEEDYLHRIDRSDQ